MDHESLSIGLVKPRQNDDLIADRYAIQTVRGKAIDFKPRIRSPLRTLFGRLASLLEFRSDYPDGAKLKRILRLRFSCSPFSHAARVSQLSMVFASTRPACWNSS